MSVSNCKRHYSPYEKVHRSASPFSTYRRLARCLVFLVRFFFFFFYGNKNRALVAAGLADIHIRYMSRHESEKAANA